MKQNLFLPKTALAFLMVSFSTWGWGQGALSNPIFSENFGTLSNDADLTLSNTAFSWIRVGTSTSGSTAINSITAKNPSTFTGSSGLISAKGGSVSTVDKTSLASFNIGVLTFKFRTPNSLSSAVMVGAVGTGGSFGGNSGITGSHLSAAFQISGGNLQIRTSSGWTTVQSVTAATNYTVALVFNNTTGNLSYGDSNSLPANKTDIWVNGTKFSTQYTAATSNLSASAFRIYTTSAEFEVDDIAVYNSLPTASPPTWNGTSWDNGTPTASTPAIINANYTAGSFTAQSVTVNSGFTLNINANQTVTTGNITNNGAIVVNDNGNLIQTGTTSTYTAGTNATFTLNKAYATNVAGKYAFWSSPVQNQNMFTAFTTQPTDVTTYNTSTNYYDAVSNFTNNSGKGYSILMPVGGSAVFTGAPNNGTVNVGLSNSSFGYNLVGNPYPSNLSLTSFLSANNGNISPTLYFWDNTSAPVANQTGQTSSNYGYATFNANGSGTWNSAQSITNGTGNNIDLTNAPALINPSQAFIVKSINGTDLIFNNDMRNSAAATFVNKNGSNSSEGKYWLRLKTPLSANNTLAVTYGEGAINALDGFDSKAIALGSDAFYSKVLDDKLAIQGRTDFVNTDVVPLGSKHFTDGLHTISLANKTGIFNNGQAIYLHDKVLGTYTNLQNTSYNFTVNAGETADRFELVYLLGTLSTSEAQKGSFEIYRDGNDFYARNNKTIDSIEVFDASGRKVQQINSASQLVRIPLDSKGFYIIKAKSAGKEYSKKITY